MQDSKGFMWFGTDDGLNRFDGQSFIQYRHNSRLTSNEGLLHDRIKSLFEDSTGKIWICTNGGTCYYNYETDTFHPLMLTSDQTNPDNFDEVQEDNRKNLWFREYNRIIKYNPTSNSTRIYSAEECGFHSLTMAMTQENIPVFADHSSLYFYKYENDSFTRTPVMEEKDNGEEGIIQKICHASEVGVLVGSNKGGLKIYYPTSDKTELLIPDIYVRDIMPYNSNVYWIASESGLFIYNLIDKSVTNLRKSLTNEYTLSDNAIYSLTKDKEGGVWVGSFFGGINYLPKDYTHFNYYIGGKTHPGMLGNTVREICPDKYGNLWLSTEDNGINRYNPLTDKMDNYSFLNPNRKLSATNIHGIYADGDTLWVGTFNKGIDLLHIPSGKIIKHYTQANTHNTLPSDFILCFYKTREGQFLIGTSSGIVVYNKKTDSFFPWKECYGLIRQIYEDQKGNIWAVSSMGLFKYTVDTSANTSKMHKYEVSDTSKKQGLGSNNITSVFEDSKGRIWITTSYGFSLYNEHTDNFNRITTEDGLPSNLIYRIVEDDDKLFWISTANGLVKFNPESFAMKIYTHKEGLHESQFNYSSSYKAKDGTIYMGTIDGMISFNPKSFTEDTFSPPLYITRVHIPDNPKMNVQLEALSGETPYILKLPYNTPTFTLSYIAPGYTSPGAIQYSYILEGVDKDWIYMGANKEVTFAGLSPGEYTFKVKSTNSSNIWQQNERALRIVITPPFWATKWAYLSYILFLGGCLIAFYKYKKKKLEKRHRYRQKQFEMEKENELYNAKIQFFTFITHEIRTPLTLIKAPLEKIIRSNEGTDTTRHNLRIIEKNTQRLLDLSNQLLDFRKTESKGFRLSFVRTDIIIWLDTILQPFFPVFAKEKKTIQIHIPSGHFFAYIDREAFAKIVSNLLTNALKYSIRNTTLLLQLPYKGENLFTVTVINDGSLVPEEDKEKIFTPFYRVKETENMPGSGIGLSLSRSLAEFHNGNLSYYYTEDGLNGFSLTLPVKQTENCFEDSTDVLPLCGNVNKGTHTDRLTILIVEDQSDMRRFIMDELETTYHILEAENGKTAIKILETYSVDMIISDIMMPEMDGFELCNEVKNNILFSHIPFILLTAQHNLQSRLEGLNKGADAYMEKPFSLDLLTAQIKNLFKNRKILNKAYQEKPNIPTLSLAVSPLDDIFLQKMNAYLEENLTNENLSVEMIANEMGMSNSSLYRKVKGLSGLSPVDFIRIARLKKAVRLMEQGEKRISEIAFLVGFSSPAYFSTCFQKQYGKSPSEFMKGK